MRTFPISPRSAMVEWCQAHAPVFEENAATIGMSAAQAEEFADLTHEANKLMIAQAEAQQAAAVATQRVQQALAALQAGAGDAVRSIRAHAELNDSPNTVYNVAQIAPPSDPTPVPPPDQPKQLAIALTATTGALTLTWKASNPRGTAGTSYLVRRRLPGERAFTLLGVTGQKRFVDETIPAGMRQVEYTVQGQRGKRTGALSQIFFVSIGQGDAAGEKVESVGGNANGQSGAVQNASAWGEGIVMGTGDIGVRA